MGAGNRRYAGIEAKRLTHLPDRMETTRTETREWDRAAYEQAARELLAARNEERGREARRRAEAGRRAKAAAGGLNGCAPVGYVNRRQGSRTWVEIDPVQGPLVREAFELYATGEYSLRGLLKIMTEKGLLSRNGKAMGVSALHWMLNNPFYDGEIRARSDAYPGSHVPLGCRRATEALKGR